MQKRSNQISMSMPVVYAQHPELGLPVYPAKRTQPAQLHVFDLTYLHFHNVLEIGICIKGRGVCNVEGVEYPFSEGDVQIVLPYQRHLSKNTQKEPCQWYWLYIDPAELLTHFGFLNAEQVQRILQNDVRISGIIDRQSYPRICELSETLIKEMYEPLPNRVRRTQYYAACFCMLLMELCQSGEKEDQQAVQTRELEEIAPALLRIKEAVDQAFVPTVAELQALCGMSPASFRRKFKCATGVPAKEYISICCVRRACSLLKNTDMKVIEIAGKCGFGDISGFNRCFLKHVGIAPRAYRKME